MVSRSNRFVLTCVMFMMLGMVAPAWSVVFSLDDIDGDGIPNIVDPDVDNDGIPNALDRNVDGGIAKFGPMRGRWVGDRLSNDSTAEKDIDGDGLLDDSLAELEIGRAHV